jgi:hypothetical protein
MSRAISFKTPDAKAATVGFVSAQAAQTPLPGR